MASSDIPGYFYDPEKNRYFKLAHHNLPDFITQDKVNCSVADEETQTKIALAKQYFNFLSLPGSGLSTRLDNREHFWKSTGINFYRDVGFSYLRNLTYRQSVVNQCFGKCILSPSGYWLHSIQENHIETFRLSWEVSGKKSGNELAKFRLRRQPSNVEPLVGFTPKDVTWIQPGHTFAVLGSFMGLPTVFCVQRTGTLLSNSPLEVISPRKISVKFATSPDCAEAPYDLITHQPESVYRLESDYTSHSDQMGVEVKENVIFFSQKTVYLYNRGRCCQLHRVANEEVISACAVADTQSLKEVSHPPLYIAKSNGILEFICQPDKPLIKFNANHPFGRIDRQSEGLITCLKTVLTSSGDRIGLLVSRRCGLLQLWDDRWPNSPAVQYKGSRASSRLAKIASHIPLQPTAALSFNWNYPVVACPLLASPCVELWELSTGRPLNTLQPTVSYRSQPSAPPPQIFFRTMWPNSRGLPRRGPALVTVEQCALHSFYA